ncbi:hypothetical protein [Escherichia coli]|uniref:hypothetical protein n=1 Tax=Escherichia coli TaxID=562 RepID=UPI00207BC0B9|nr:hypothetical protein [Escherichia coli]
MKLSAPVAELSRVRLPSSQLPQPQTVFANTQSSAKTGFFRDSGEAVRSVMLEEYRRFMQLNELVSVVTATDSTGTLRREKTSMNPKKLA